ncbi:MAG: FAD-dependent oxidoreductase [Bryobacter sp.]|nr:FAD-dependent oxidoreductase [Bryobacter sp. CoA8 C33]
MPLTSRRHILKQTGLAGALAAGQGIATASTLRCDVSIHAATPAGIAAAVAAGRLGRSVILSESEDHIGGIVSNGLTNADIGKRQAVGGLFHEFTRRVLKHYQQQDQGNPDQPNVKLCRDGYWYEASVAEKVFHDLIGSAGGRVRLLLRHELRSAKVSRGRLTAITLGDLAGGPPVEIRAKVFLDATYEGDLAALSGAPFRTGREGRDEYGEPHAGRIYMKFRGSELLPGSTGEADEAVQGYCFRFHVTNVAAKRVPIEKPRGFERLDYQAVLDDLRAGRVKRFRDVIQIFPLPNGRFELNSNHPNPDTGVPSESLDLTEDNWDWPTATPARRKALYQRILTHNVGLIWLLQNDPEVPEAIRADARQWGWHRDEWPGNNHLPRQVYVRQGRRILGEAILTEKDGEIDPPMQRTRLRKDSIAIVEWDFDPHGHHKYDPRHPGVREGYFFVAHPPFQVPYGILAPREIDALLVPVACSCSHVAYNALRMEPVFMALGEAAGIAAHLAVSRNTPVRRVPVPLLQKILVERRGVITFFEDVPFDHPAFAALQFLGARGLNLGYTAQPEAACSAATAWDALERILRIEARPWRRPPAEPGAPLLLADLAAQLHRAGYRVHLNRPQDGGVLTVAQFATVVYQALQPAEI